MRTRIVTSIVAAALTLVSCGGDEPPQARQSSPSPSASSPAPTSSAPPLNLSDIDIRVQEFAGGFSQPVFLTHAGDGSGSVYVVEQGGRILVLDANGERRSTFLNISDRVESGGERGLLGLAFHPDYESNGRFFVYYSNNAGDNVVSRFQRRTATSANPDSERLILRMDDPFSNHNGGWIAFGPDGFLYVATGDGGSGGDPLGNGQSLRTLLGKILRIDVNRESPYAIPADNPFVDRAGARREIWAYGLRNPWRNAFDRATGHLYIGDVGQGGREELDVQRSGRGGVNFGWNTMEGTRCFDGDTCDRSGLTLPFAEYPTAEGCAVTGGYVYRGTRFPQLAGAYFFGDYCNGRIFGIDARRALGGDVLSERRLLDSGIGISSFGEDEAGELYVVGHGGTIHRLLAS